MSRVVTVRTVSLRAVFMLILACCGSTSWGELVVSSDFVGGNAVVVEQDAATQTLHIRPQVRPERGWPCWWYVRVDGLKPGQELQLTVSAATEPFLANRVLDAAWALPQQAAISTDNLVWEQTPRGERQGNQMLYRIAVPQPTLWLAWGPPFLPAHAESLLKEAHQQLSGSELFTLATTREGRPVQGIRLGTDGPARPHAVWIQARQHAWESGGSWVGAGFLKWAVSDDPAAVALREQTEIYFVPIMDVDNVSVGAGGKDAVPRDHNRDWVEESRYPEVAAAQQKILELNRSERLVVYIDLHNPGPGDRQPFFFGPKLDKLSAQQQQNYARWMGIAQTTITDLYQGYRYTDYIKTDEELNRMSSNWVRNHSAGHLLSVTLETAWNRPQGNIAGYLRVGQQLGETLARYLEDSPRTGN